MCGFSSKYAQAASFQGVGDLPGGFVSSAAQGVSADGQFVVGASYSTVSGNQPEAYRWTQVGGMVGLGFFPSPILSSRAAAVSADGAVVVGSGLVNNAYIEAFRWTQAAGLVGLGDLPGGIVQSFPFAVSANGGVVVGFSSAANGREAFLWAGGMVGLGDLPQNDFYSEAYGVSADGSVVVGYSRSGGGPEAFRWTQAGGMVGLGAPDQNQFESRASGVSADGTIVVGYAWYGLFQPFRWTQAGGMVKLGDLPSGVLTTQVPPVAVSADGGVVVGTGYPGDPFIWDATHGIRNLRDLLVNQHGLNLTGWTLTNATAISADGLTIVGNGIHAGFGEGWIARLGDPPPTCQNNSDCDDGLFCNGAETCLGGACQAGTVPNCSDGVACTDDSCAANMCVHMPNDAQCLDDGLYCNGPEICDLSGGCISLGDPCAGQPCNEPSDLCGCLENMECDDGTLCSFDECVSNSCQHSTRSYGDVNGDGFVNVNDALCELDAFAGIPNPASCGGSASLYLDIAPCPSTTDPENMGDGFANADDALAVLDAFAGVPACSCPNP